jgi:uncharacterized protein (TIGR03437 family)
LKYFYLENIFMSLNRAPFRWGFGVILLISLCAATEAAPSDRITGPVDPAWTRLIPGNLHRLAQPQYDQGAVDPALKMNYVVLVTKRTQEQQTALDALLAAQQNPSSPQFHKWLMPEEFGNRYGLSTGDQAKIVGWLQSQGLTINHAARSQNWIAFSGSAAQVAGALHTSFHRFEVNGKTHFANVSDPAVPEALADTVDGFLGLNDFRLMPGAIAVPPDYNTGGSHYLAPQDFATIYNINPLYQQLGLDGTGQSIAVVGESDVLLTDLRAFKTRYGLPQNDPKMYLWGDDPGYNGAQLEGNLDLEWSSAIAPKASIYYVYGTDPFTSIVVAVELDVAPIITISYGECEIDFSAPYYRAVAQQANAQGITLLAASGDTGAAACQDRGVSATHGETVSFPTSLPEVTGVGGTEFVEGSGNYWSPTNSSAFGSALSYIPEAVWNESNSGGVLAGGGGASSIFSKPAWQTGPGVPADNARDVPDVALTAALHDAYEVYFGGVNEPVGGTSASTPSMAGIIALLNQYQISKGFQKVPGLGNINPQLYRLAQSAPSVFHDITNGNNIVPCAQGTVDCSTGSFGYSAGPGYDLASGLGSIDANALVTQWNTATSPVSMDLSASTSRANINSTIQLTATVVPASGTGSPTGSVNFVYETNPLGSAPLTNGSATISFPMYELGGIGTATVAAQYSGDAAFSAGGAILNVQVTASTGEAAVVVFAPSSVFPQPADAAGLSWQTGIVLQEFAGVPALVTGFTIDGQAQSLAQYFPSPNILPGGSVTVNIVLRNQAAPVTHVFGFTGTDAGGNAWSRQASVVFAAIPAYNYGNLSATPLVVEQNPAADPSCQWRAQLNLDDQGGYGIYLLSNLYAGGIDLSSQIPLLFGTTRVAPYSGLQATLCFAGINPPSSETIGITLSSGATQGLTLSFTGPANAGSLSVTPPSVSFGAPAPQPRIGPDIATTPITISLPDKVQTWTASIYPANITTSWLTLSQYSGVGPTNVILTANPAGIEPGAYRATIVIQSPNTVPQYVNVPVMFVLGTSGGMTITSIANSFSFQNSASPGMLLSILGSQLSNTTATASGNPTPVTLNGVSAVVNGIAAPIFYESPGLLNIQVPYEVGAGPAVLGLTNNGLVTGFQLKVAPSSPGIWVDAMGKVEPTATAQQGGQGTIYFTGAGDVTPALKTAYATSAAASSQPVPLLPVSVTVGGLPALLESSELAPGLIGITQVTFVVPSTVPAGVQPVVVTVGGVASQAANLNVTAGNPVVKQPGQ